MEEEFRPALREVVLAYAWASVLLWLLVSWVVSLLPVPGFVVSPVEELAGLLAAIFFVFRVSAGIELHVEERYSVGEGVLRIRRNRGFGPVTVLLQNVDAVRVETPLLLRPFGVGTVWVYTIDCRARPLY
ncbi:MAG: hypothetical protein JRM82_03620, partial [Nitrososphaerota archaeon]|nr:hypothetical protein [Nitrososphaerota archaeon]